MTARLESATALAWWVRNQAPGIYRALAQKARGLGCVSCQVGGLGQDVSVDPSAYTPDLSTPAPTEVDITASPITLPFDTVDPTTFQPVTIDSPTGETPILTTDPSDYTGAPAQGPSVLSQVGSFLTTGGGLTALLNLGTQVLRNQQSNAVLSAQAARVAAGYNPAAITYRTNSVGQTVPYLNTPSGPVPLTQPLLSSLTPGTAGFLQQYGIWVLLALGLMLVARR